MTLYGYIIMFLILVVLGLTAGITYLSIENEAKEAKLDTLRDLVFYLIDKN